MVMVGLGRVVSKVGKDSVKDIEGFEGFVHLGLPSSRSGSIKMRNQRPRL